MFKVKSFKKNHPNPSFYRSDYIILDGMWDFCFDYHNQGRIKGFHKNFPISDKINVPYSYLSKSSNINIQTRCDHVWYHRIIDHSIDENYRTFIIFEGSDYKTTLYINGKYVGKNIGGYHRFSFDITDYLKEGDNDITVKVSDNMSILKVRGKQRFRKNNFWCWYEETTGIWKTVWLEKRPNTYIDSIKLTPSFKTKSFKLELTSNEIINNLSIKVNYKNTLVYNVTNLRSLSNEIEVVIPLSVNFHPWDILKPNLYDIELKLASNILRRGIPKEYTDTVLSYIGIRDIYTKENKIYLNDHPIYQKLILDQGYIDNGDMTMTDEELEFDINAMIEMGFNGARKHQKIEIEKYYSYADFYGYLVWLEMPSMYLTLISSAKRFMKEWSEILKQFYNHPAIITYTPFNESWGIWGIDRSDPGTKLFVKKVYDLTKSYDSTRLVTTNDGWSHLNSDIITLHLYNQDKESLKYDIDRAFNENFVNYKKGRKFVLKREYLFNKPVILDEFGGTSFLEENKVTFGYGDDCKTLDEFENRLKDLFSLILDDNRFVGYCYTQLSDVRQEMNGLYTMDRKIKIPSDIMKDIQRS
ncbi:glycoside hydrolase family 2 [bacterium]|nr:glycoside hydrolase family 2 [bacterium]